MKKRKMKGNIGMAPKDLPPESIKKITNIMIDQMLGRMIREFCQNSGFSFSSQGISLELDLSGPQKKLIINFGEIFDA